MRAILLALSSAFLMLVYIKILNDSVADFDASVLVRPLSMNCSSGVGPQTDGSPDLSKQSTLALNIARLEVDLINQIRTADCSKHPFIVYTFRELAFGLGAQFNMIISSVSFVMGLPGAMGYVVFKDPDHWNYALSRQCTHGWMCYFEPPSQCQHSATPNHFQLTVNGKITHFQSFGMPFRYPLPLRYASVGALEYYTAVTKFLWRPVGWVQAEIDKLVSGIDLTGGFIAMHVRYGDDKKRDKQYLPWEIQGALERMKNELGFIPLDEYMRVAEGMRQRQSQQRAVRSTPSRILLATDDEGIAEQAKLYRSNWSITILDKSFRQIMRRVKGRRRASKAFKFGYSQVPDKNNHASAQDGLDVIRLIDLLSRADYFIGTFSSCMSRTIYQLGRSRGNFLAPESFHSLDIPWFPDP